MKAALNDLRHGVADATVVAWLLAALLALLLSSAWLLGGASDIEAAQDVAADLHEAIESVAASAGAERASGQYDHQSTVAAVNP